MSGPLAVGGGSGFAAAKVAQQPNVVFAGPAALPAALPAFRALVEADYPFAVSLAPATSLRNVIQPTGAFVPLHIKTNTGVEALYVASDGKVGIGTVAPGAKLDVVKDYGYGDLSSAALKLSSATTPAKSLQMGYDISLDAAVIQAVHSGTSGKAILFNTTGGNVGIGQPPLSPSTLLHVVMRDAIPAAVTNVLTLGHNSSGTPAAGFGTGLLIQGKSSTTVNRDMARRRALWIVPTDASRLARLVDSVFNVAAEVDVVGQSIDGADVADVQAYHFGRPNADGTWPDGVWRAVRSGNNLVFERRETGAWVQKGIFNA